MLALQRRLRDLGSDLLILEGPAAVVLPALTQQMGIEEIVAEEEIEYRCTMPTDWNMLADLGHPQEPTAC